MYKVHHSVIVLLLLFPFAAWAQDEEVGPISDTDTGAVYDTGCSNLCSAVNCALDVDNDPDGSGDANQIGPQGVASATVRLNMDTPAENPSTAGSAQTVQILADKAKTNTDCTPAGSGGDPTITVTVYCNGVALGETPINAYIVTDTIPNGTSGTWTFNTTDCASDGSDVQFNVTMTSTGGGPNYRSAQLDSIEWEVTYASDERRIMVVD